MYDGNNNWLIVIIIGGLAGWIASYVMHANTGIFLNIILGVVGYDAISYNR